MCVVIHARMHEHRQARKSLNKHTGLYVISLTRPESTTCTMSSIVNDISATFVACKARVEGWMQHTSVNPRLHVCIHVCMHTPAHAHIPERLCVSLEEEGPLPGFVRPMTVRLSVTQHASVRWRHCVCNTRCMCEYVYTNTGLNYQNISPYN